MKKAVCDPLCKQVPTPMSHLLTFQAYAALFIHSCSALQRLLNQEQLMALQREERKGPRKSDPVSSESLTPAMPAQAHIYCSHLQGLQLLQQARKFLSASSTSQGFLLSAGKAGQPCKQQGQKKPHLKWHIAEKVSHRGHRGKREGRC